MSPSRKIVFSATIGILGVVISVLAVSLSRIPSNLLDKDGDQSPLEIKAEVDETSSLPSGDSPQTLRSQFQSEQNTLGTSLSKAQRTQLTRIFESHRSAFVDRNEMIKDLLADDPDVPKKAFALLMQTPSSSAIQQRMSALDVLETLMNDEEYPAEVADQARTLMRSTVLAEIAPGLSESQKRIFMSEKHDALVALARRSPDEASSLFQQIKNRRVREILEPVLYNALFENGKASGDVKQVADR